MVSFVATSDVVHALHEARSIALGAYALRPGQMLRALEAAASAGAKVEVSLEGRPYADPTGSLARANRHAIACLRAAGADARLVDRDGTRPAHIKAAVVDGVAFLDDRNWPSGGGNTVVRDDDPRDVSVVRAAVRGYTAADRTLVTDKRAALRQEARVLEGALQTHGEASVESESFTAGTQTYTMLKALAGSGVSVRLLVAQRDVKPGSLGALRILQRAGVAIRLGDATEKLAVGGRQGWIGSANASHGTANQSDWGLRITRRTLRTELLARFDTNWMRAKPLAAPEGQRVPARSHR